NICKRLARAPGLSQAFLLDSNFSESGLNATNVWIIAMSTLNLNQPEESILLVLPARAHNVKGRIFFDTQGCNGLRLWLKHFSNVTMVCPTELTNQAPPLASPLDSVQGFDRIKFVDLLIAYTPLRFFAKSP